MKPMEAWENERAARAIREDELLGEVKMLRALAEVDSATIDDLERQQHNLRAVVEMLYSALEEQEPIWYTRGMYKRIVEALQTTGS